jgi:hypothetical protein
VDPAEDLLRRLALNDEAVLSRVLTPRVDADRRIELSSKVELLLRLGALQAVGAATPSLKEAGPTMGLASLVAAAPKLAIAIGHDLENGHEGAE